MRSGGEAERSPRIQIAGEYQGILATACRRIVLGPHSYLVEAHDLVKMPGRAVGGANFESEGVRASTARNVQDRIEQQSPQTLSLHRSPHAEVQHP